jgi:hypothetical protein
MVRHDATFNMNQGNFMALHLTFAGVATDLLNSFNAVK